MKFELEDTLRRKVSDEDLIQDLKRVAAIYGRSMSNTEYSLHGKYSHRVFVRAFGGWQNALEAAGLERTQGDMSDASLIQDLKHVAATLGHSPTRDEYEANGHYSNMTLRKRFGGWLNALSLAGLEETDHKLRIDDDLLFENLETLWLKLGRQPRRDEVHEPLSKYSIGPYTRRFGSWMGALKAFVEAANNSEQKDGEESEIIPQASPIEDNLKKTAERDKRRTPSLGLRWQVYKRDNFRCFACGRSPAKDPGIELHVDHVIPWAKGGKTDLENLRLLCSDCNLGKSDT